MTMYENPFHLDLPHGWEDQTVYYFRGPDEGGKEHMLTLVLNRNLQYDNVATFAKDYTEPIESTLQSVEVMKDEEITLENGNQAYEYVYKWMPAEGITIIKKYVFVIKDRMGYTFSCEFSRRTLKTVGVGMKNVIESLVPGTYQPLEED